MSIVDPSSTQLIGLGEGTIVVPRGSVAYLVQCANVTNEVFLRNSTECTYDCPVMFRGKSVFRDPRTYIIKESSIPVNCEDEYSIHR